MFIRASYEDHEVSFCRYITSGFTFARFNRATTVNSDIFKANTEPPEITSSMEIRSKEKSPGAIDLSPFNVMGGFAMGAAVVYAPIAVGGAAAGRRTSCNKKGRLGRENGPHTHISTPKLK